MLDSLRLPVSYRGLAPHNNHAHDGRTQSREPERRIRRNLKSTRTVAVRLRWSFVESVETQLFGYVADRQLVSRQ
jgi:hypothetical protein